MEVSDTSPNQSGRNSANDLRETKIREIVSKGCGDETLRRLNSENSETSDGVWISGLGQDTLAAAELAGEHYHLSAKKFFQKIVGGILPQSLLGCASFQRYRAREQGWLTKAEVYRDRNGGRCFKG